MTNPASDNTGNLLNNPLGKISKFLLSLSGPEQIICGLPIVWMVTVFTNLDKFPEDKRVFMSLSSGAGVALAWIIVLGRQLYLARCNNIKLESLKKQLSNQIEIHREEILTDLKNRIDQLTDLKTQAGNLKTNLQAVQSEGLISAEVYDLLGNNINSLLEEIEEYLEKINPRALEIRDAPSVVKPIEQNQKLVEMLDAKYLHETQLEKE
ncbi:MAG: hypothetical protein AAGA75_08910 [Cyanobacteria bacterium P01_E01_bin.6]